MLSTLNVGRHLRVNQMLKLQNILNVEHFPTFQRWYNVEYTHSVMNQKTKRTVILYFNVKTTLGNKMMQRIVNIEFLTRLTRWGTMENATYRQGIDIKQTFFDIRINLVIH